MAEGARAATDAGADMLDINMGCPAKKVTSGYSGSALMRDLDHAMSLIEATIAATHLPVTLKMRLGWDHSSLNAPELARRAEQGRRPAGHRPRPHALPVLRRGCRLGRDPPREGGRDDSGDCERRLSLDRRRRADACGERRRRHHGRAGGLWQAVVPRPCRCLFGERYSASSTARTSARRAGSAPLRGNARALRRGPRRALRPQAPWLVR